MLVRFFSPIFKSFYDKDIYKSAAISMKWRPLFLFMFCFIWLCLAQIYCGYVFIKDYMPKSLEFENSTLLINKTSIYKLPGFDTPLVVITKDKNWANENNSPIVLLNEKSLTVFDDQKAIESISYNQFIENGVLLIKDLLIVVFAFCFPIVFIATFLIKIPEIAILTFVALAFAKTKISKKSFFKFFKIVLLASIPSAILKTIYYILAPEFGTFAFADIICFAITVWLIYFGTAWQRQEIKNLIKK